MFFFWNLAKQFWFWVTKIRQGSQSWFLYEQTNEMRSEIGWPRLVQFGLSQETETLQTEGLIFVWVNRKKTRQQERSAIFGAGLFWKTRSSFHITFQHISYETAAFLGFDLNQSLSQVIGKEYVLSFSATELSKSFFCS